MAYLLAIGSVVGIALPVAALAWGAMFALDVLGRVEPPASRFVLLARKSGSALGRCGYCHDDLRAPVLACSACSTALHAGCLEELKRCPVLGCRGSLVAV